MQDRYVGDVGDYGKFGLLRALCGYGWQKPNLKLSIVWYRTIPEDKESRLNDGKHRSYISKPQQYRDCNPELFDKMEILQDKNNRNVSSICSSGIFPISTTYYEELLSFSRIPFLSMNSIEKRIEYRRNWLVGAMRSSHQTDLTFLDPDNGLEIKTVSPTSKNGPKFITEEELKSFLKLNRILVLYQHAWYDKNFISISLERVNHLCPERNIFALLYRRGTQRAFIIIPTAETHTLLLHRTKVFLSSEWHNHFAPEIFFP